MPAPNIPLPPSLGPKHLYRHLLREVSYLPPAIRPFFAHSVRDRFRKHRPRDSLTDQHRKTGMRVLRKFRGANSGDRAAMADIILRGLGRVGYRRRLLFEGLKALQGPDNAEGVEKILQAETQLSQKAEAKSQKNSDPQPVASPTIRGKNSWLNKWNLPRLKSFVKSQVRQQSKTKNLTSWPGTPAKGADDMTNMPELNIWGKPLHPGRVETRRATWWKRTALKVMPPLEAAEFETLEKVANGAQETDEQLRVPSRRPLARQLAEDVQEGLGWDLEAYATQSATNAERPKMKYQRRSGRAAETPYTEPAKDTYFSDRFFRRQYQRALLLSSKTEQDPNTLDEKFTWGSIRAKSALPTKEQMAIFENLPEMGNKKNKNKAP